MRIKTFSTILLIFVFFTTFAVSLFAVQVVPIKVTKTVDYTFACMTEEVVIYDSDIVAGIK